eukprot:m.93540 g.93540  ORF g.93540 m.93540 type:complete len:345 (+) comp15376_c1_seq1:150-1184(+)
MKKTNKKQLLIRYFVLSLLLRIVVLILLRVLLLGLEQPLDQGRGAVAQSPAHATGSFGGLVPLVDAALLQRVVVVQHVQNVRERALRLRMLHDRLLQVTNQLALQGQRLAVVAQNRRQAGKRLLQIVKVSGTRGNDGVADGPGRLLWRHVVCRARARHLQRHVAQHLLVQRLGQPHPLTHHVQHLIVEGVVRISLLQALLGLQAILVVVVIVIILALLGPALKNRFGIAIFPDEVVVVRIFVVHIHAETFALTADLLVKLHVVVLIHLNNIAAVGWHRQIRAQHHLMTDNDVVHNLYVVLQHRSARNNGLLQLAAVPDGHVVPHKDVLQFHVGTNHAVAADDTV